MPFIRFDDKGVCNYCTDYRLRNKPRPTQELFDLVEPYRRTEGLEVIVPFSGGRDSCYALHLVVNELGLRPVTYTYDWGMVTDLGRRNISRMSAALGVENIIVAANITKKRNYISRNLRAWLKAPNLGMLSILTAGDKQFFRYVEAIKRQTGVNLEPVGCQSARDHSFQGGLLGCAARLRRAPRVLAWRGEATPVPTPPARGHDPQSRLFQPFALGHAVGGVLPQLH